MKDNKREMELPEFIENINILRLFCGRFDKVDETCDTAIAAVQQQQEIKNGAVLKLPCRIRKCVLYLNQGTPDMLLCGSEEQAERALYKKIAELGKNSV